MNNTHDFLDEAKAHASIHHFEDTHRNPNEQYSTAKNILKSSLETLTP